MENIVSLFPIVLAFGVAYFLFIRPQQKRTREHEALLKQLDEGDEVQLASGIFGFITAIDGSIVWVEVSPGVELKVARSSVANKVVADDEESE